MPSRGVSLSAHAETNRRSLRDERLRAGRIISALALAAALILCWRVAEVRPTALFNAAAISSVWAFVRGLFPPDLSPGFLSIVAAAIVQTVAIAFAGTVLSILIGLPLGVLSTATLYRRGVLVASEPRGWHAALLAWASRMVRAVLSFLRAVPDLVWGLLFVSAVGLGSVAGTLALAISYAGVLGRVYADVFEDVDQRPVEALCAAGATRAQIFLRAILPQAMPGALAYTFYSFECCVRAASVLGFVGAGGIGYEIGLSMRLFEYNQVLTLLLTFICLLAVTDAVSRTARRRLHSKAMRGGESLAQQTSAVSFVRRAPDYFVRRTPGSVAGLMLLLAVGLSFYATGLTGGALFEAGLAARVVRFVGAMLPPDLDPAFLRSLALPLLQTISISVIGTLAGVLIGTLLALPAASTLMLVEMETAGHRSIVEQIARRLSYVTARLLAGILRSVPELVWVLICIIAVGLGPFAGTLAIGLHTGGVLGRLYADTLEETPARPVEALRAAGAGTFQILLWGIWPQARPTLVSYTMLRWEMNLRAATVLGLVGGGGLGQVIFNSIQLGFYPRVATLILLVYALVTATDWIGDGLRARHIYT